MLALPWPAPPWSLNDRLNRWDEAKVKADIRDTTRLLTKQLRIGRLERVRVGLHVLPAQTRVRDSENPVPTLKVACDAIVDAGVVDDDDTWRMVKDMPVIYLPVRGYPPRMWLTLEELEAVPDAPTVRSKPKPAVRSKPKPAVRAAKAAKAIRSGPRRSGS